MNRKTCQILLTVLLFLAMGLIGEAWGGFLSGIKEMAFVVQ